MNLLDTGTLLAGDRMEYRLGRLVAEGGEGKVYVVHDRDDIVAKVYKRYDFRREEKLRHLISMGSKPLRRIAAWPLSVLQDAEGQTIGFVMERLTGWQRLHNVYQPNARRQHHPERGFDFLVRTARNLATCLHHLHEAGVVVGDLNESNILVDPKAMVKLIDADSFQVKADALFECPVGKGEFTAPELQGADLNGLERTPEHDRFALAVLIFQTLVLGRHPFAGRPEGDREVSIEEAIRNGWYAYTLRRQVPISPPKSLDLNWLPVQIQALFERAFDPSETSRPSAKDWYHALKQLENSFAVCPVDPIHRYYSGSEGCPWCQLRLKTGVAFFSSEGQPREEIVPDWLLEKQFLIEPPKTSVDPTFGHSLSPSSFTPLKKLQGLRLAIVTTQQVFLIWLGLAVLFMFLASGFAVVFALALLCIFVLIAATIGLQGVLFLIENQAHKNFSAAQTRLRGLHQAYLQQAHPKLFQQRLNEVERARELLRNSDKRKSELRGELMRRRFRPQFEAFLVGQSLVWADPMISPYELHNLRTQGIENAYDVWSGKLSKLNDVDELTNRDLQRWLTTLETRYWAESNFQLSPEDEQEWRQRFAREIAQCRQTLLYAGEDLRSLCERMEEAYRRIADEASPLQAKLDRAGSTLRSLSRRFS